MASTSSRPGKMKSLGIAVLTVLAVVTPAAIAYSCGTQQVRYTTSCGFWGWSRCTYYRSVPRTCSPIHGGWSQYGAWSAYTACSVSCGGGTQTQTRTRSCTKPVPQYGGKQCVGSATDTNSRTCNTHPCPIHGGWSQYGAWSAYTACSVSCGGGTQTQTRTRSCTKPVPQYGGKQCVGSATDTNSRTCNTHPCPIHGGWSQYGAWSAYTACSVSCGGGTQTQSRTRSCTKPVPQYGGKQCVGSATDTNSRTCNTHPCPIDGGWTDWEEWQDIDECSVLCGGGLKDQERSRSCTNPAPAYGGADCEGVDYEKKLNVSCAEEECGEKCPDGEITYLTHSTNQRRFYQCSNGIAHRHECPDGTVYDPESSACIHAETTDESCPSEGVVMLAHNDCTKFNMCVHGRKTEQRCPATTRYDPELKVCVHNYGECEES